MELGLKSACLDSFKSCNYTGNWFFFGRSMSYRLVSFSVWQLYCTIGKILCFLNHHHKLQSEVFWKQFGFQKVKKNDFVGNVEESGVLDVLFFPGFYIFIEIRPYFFQLKNIITRMISASFFWT